MSPKTDPLSANGTVALGVLTLIVLLGAGGTWATLTRISGAIIASGRIEVAQNRQVVQHPRWWRGRKNCRQRRGTGQRWRHPDDA